MALFQPDDKVLVNGKHAEVKTLKDIGGGHFEVGVVYTEDKRFDTVIYPFTENQKIDSPIESAKKLKFDPSWKYDLATDALRFKHAYLYDPLFSLSTTRIDALPHQIEAVYDKILPAHEQRFLLADDPGLGKTIMAGMVIKELHARGRANRGIVEMTENEWKTAQKLKDNYWLYVVENALNEPKKNIFTIRNPSERFKEVKIIRQETRYLISDWKTKV